jgi:excinuclease UvrABC nuclease subunit
VDTGSRFPSVKIVDRPGRKGDTIGPFVNRWAVEALVEQLREVYGLRRCAARITKRAGEVACDFRESGECPGPCVGRIDPDEYQARFAEALAVFDESAEGLRRELEQRHERALHDGDHEGAIRTRDALKALERSMSGLRLVREATSRPGLIILEPQDGTVALHLVRFGYLARTLRLKRSDWGTPRFEDAVHRGIHRAYYSGPYVDNPDECDAHLQERAAAFEKTAAKLAAAASACRAERNCAPRLGVLSTAIRETVSELRSAPAPASREVTRRRIAETLGKAAQSLNRSALLLAQAERNPQRRASLRQSAITSLKASHTALGESFKLARTRPPE